MAKIEASINDHDALEVFDWARNFLTQAQTGAESGVGGTTRKHRKVSLDTLRSLLVEVANVVNDLTTEEPGKVLDARQGKVLSDAIALRELLANKVSTFQSEPDDTHYPTEKLVKDALDLLTSRIDNILVGQDLDPNKDVELLDARHSNATGVTYPTLGTRLDLMEDKYKGHIYGCKMNQTTGIVVPTHESVGLTYRQQINTVGERSDFSNVYPWSEIITVKVDPDGVILTTIDHPNFASVDGDIMVRIPVFWSRAYSKDGYEHYEISDIARPGWKATGFIEPDGTILPYRLVAAVKTSNDGTVPHSWANAPPTVNKALYHATTGFQTQALAKSQQVTWSNIMLDTYEMIWRLIFVEISGHVLSGNAEVLGFNVKGAIGQGINDVSGAYNSSNANVCTEVTTNANTFILAKTRSQYFHVGMMVQVGTAYSNGNIAADRYIIDIQEHDIDNDVITLSGDTFTTTLTSTINAWGQPLPMDQLLALGNESGYVLQFGSTVKSHVCYRGIWDLWGNVYEWMTGLLRHDLQFYVCHDPVLANVNTPIGKNGWTATAIAPNIPNGYLKNRQFFDDGFGSFGLPAEGGAGSVTWYAAYLYHFNDGYMGVRAVLCGGDFSSGGVGFIWNGSSEPTVTTFYLGGRLIL